MKLLLVDDEKFAVDGLRMMLDWDSFHGELAGTAQNGEEALSLAAQTNPDVIIADIKMPVMNGLELSKAIFEHYPNTSMILLSAHNEFEYARQAIQFGVKDYILKPITRDKILQLNKRLIEMYADKVMKKEHVLSAWDSNLRNTILQKLRASDKHFFDAYFGSSEFMELMNQDGDNYAGLQILNFLFLYFSEIKVSQEAISHSKKQAMNDYLELNGVSDKMDFIITKYYDVLTSTEQRTYSNSDTLVAMALKYADANYKNSDCNISALAEELNISISHLSTIFKQSTGGNLSSYLSALRINRARELLEGGRHSIQDVAMLSGYDDSRYFARIFKKKTGYSPSEFRNRAASGRKDS